MRQNGKNLDIARYTKGMSKLTIQEGVDLLGVTPKTFYGQWESMKQETDIELGNVQVCISSVEPNCQLFNSQSYGC